MEGHDLKQFILKYKVNIGRGFYNYREEDLNEKQMIFICDSQKISRKHALINLNFNSVKWEIENLSKYKLVINGHTLRKTNNPLILDSQTSIKIDTYKFYFFLDIKGW